MTSSVGSSVGNTPVSQNAHRSTSSPAMGKSIGEPPPDEIVYVPSSTPSHMSAVSVTVSGAVSPIVIDEAALGQPSTQSRSVTGGVDVVENDTLEADR